MSLSVTRPAKKFQLFQPIGGVAADSILLLCRIGAGFGGVAAIARAGICAPATKEPKTKTPTNKIE